MIRVAIKVIFIVLWLALSIFLYFSVFNPWMYWLILLGVVIAIRQFKLNIKLIFLLTFSAFIMAAFVSLFGFEELAEVIMRISFIGLIIGFFQVFAEYRKTDNKQRV